ncbi:MAG: GGDEF domain-containing phosphodiesterase [Lachnospiraceae bacterium]|nr:GGDEF domain-containing phosphodiesterase [Lachnospiraceae bacterium]
MNKFYKSVKSISDKLKNIDKNAIRVSATVAVFFLAVWLMYLLHISNNTKRYRNVVDDFIMAQTERESEGISSAFDKRCTAISYGARTVSKVDEAYYREDLSPILTSLTAACEFEHVVFVDMNNKTYFEDGTVSADYDFSQFIDACDVGTQYMVLGNEEGILSSKSGFVIVAPVRYMENMRGYLIAFETYDNIVSISELRKEIKHDEILLDEKGDVLCRIMSDNSVEIPKRDVNFFDEAQSVMDAEEFNAFTTEYTECINARVPGKTLRKLGEGNTLLIYYPIKGTDGWAVMDCYPESVIIAITRSAEIEAIAIFVVIVIIMILAAIQIIKFLSGERRKITELEYLDGLTGVFNRNAFVNRAAEILKENKNLPYTMICFDVVNFRIINETYGHERSDVIIQELANACADAFGHNEAYGRLTADVFVALTLDDGEEGERIEYLEQHVIAKAREVYINHPIKIKRGRYEVTDVKESIDRMIDKANIARKYVNTNGTELSCRYSEELLENARKADEIESQMEEALLNGEFKPYLQGKFNMVENQVSGAEALVRWIKPDGKIVPPGDFIPLFESNGFVEKIDFYMLEEICKYLRRMIDENREVYRVSVNQSRYLLNDPEYVNKVKEILLRYQIPVGLIELELTETVFFHEKDRMIQMMNELKKMNVNLSIDDFGSGYSSFNILKDVPFDVLKIDREFLTDSVHTEKGKIILEKIVNMAHGLGMSVICEGVENEEQIELLKSINCHYAQGFYYARPIPMQEFMDKYNTPKN